MDIYTIANPHEMASQSLSCGIAGVGAAKRGHLAKFSLREEPFRNRSRAPIRDDFRPRAGKPRADHLRRGSR